MGIRLDAHLRTLSFNRANETINGIGNEMNLIALHRNANHTMLESLLCTIPSGNAHDSPIATSHVAVLANGSGHFLVTVAIIEFNIFLAPIRSINVCKHIVSVLYITGL